MISVIIPFYNAEETIIRAVKSVLMQGFIDFEIIICNDSKSSRLCDLLAGFENVKIVSNYHRNSAANSRKAAIENSSGDILMMLDADDEWMPYSKLHQLRQMHRDRLQISASDYLIRNLATPHEVPRLAKRFRGNHIDRKMLLKTCWVGNSSLIVERSLYEMCNYEDVPKEDYNFLLNATKISDISYFKRPTYYYSIGGNGVSGDKKKELVRQWQILKRHQTTCKATYFLLTYIYHGVVNRLQLLLPRSRKKDIVLMGGLGNCLFQIYVGEFWRRQGYTISYYSDLVDGSVLHQLLGWTQHDPIACELINAKRFSWRLIAFLFLLSFAFVEKQIVPQKHRMLWNNFYARYLIGYFQDVSDFRKNTLLDVAHIIDQHFKVPQPIKLAVHLRFGDSIWQGSEVNLLRFLKSEPGEMYVATDDQDAAKALLKPTAGSIKFGESLDQDFATLRAAEHVYLSDSTFGLWAAFTNTNLKKIVCSRFLKSLMPLPLSGVEIVVSDYDDEPNIAQHGAQD